MTASSIACDQIFNCRTASLSALHPLKKCALLIYIYISYSYVLKYTWRL